MLQTQEQTGESEAVISSGAVITAKSKAPNNLPNSNPNSLTSLKISNSIPKSKSHNIVPSVTCNSSTNLSVKEQSKFCYSQNSILQEDINLSNLFESIPSTISNLTTSINAISEFKPNITSSPQISQIGSTNINPTPLLTRQGSVNNIPAKIMIDSGAANDFIDYKFCRKLGCKIESVQATAILADKSESNIYGIVRNVNLSIPEWKGCRDLVVMPLSFNIILGMPWLSQVHPIINWEKLTIQLPSNSSTTAVLDSIPSKITSSQPRFSIMKPNRFAKHLRQPVELGIILLQHSMSVQLSSITTFPPDFGSGEASFFERFLENSLKSFDPEFESKLPLPKQQEIQKLRKDIRELLIEFKDIFPETLPTGLPPSRSVDHEIRLQPGAVPPAHQPYRLSHHEMLELNKTLQDLVEKGHIQPSSSPFSAPILFVKKKDNTYRMCVDYRSLNKITIKDRYPLPRIDDLLDRLHKSEYFSKIDLKSGYNQIRIKESDCPKTAFTTRYGLFEFKVMPFGLTNAPASFQRLTNDIFRQELDKSIEVFIDDILTHSFGSGNHLEHLRFTFDQLRKNKLYANPMKCSFGQVQIEFVAHRISFGHITLEKGKVDTVLNWPIPKNVTEVRQFLGFTNFYRRFIRSYAALAGPLIDLTKSSVLFAWDKRCQNAFEKLKGRIASEPVLHLPDPDQPFIIHTDASLEGLGAVLSQIFEGEEHPISFESRRLKPAEKNYSIRDLELLGLVHAIVTWRTYLFGKRFTVYTDHESLKYLQTQRNLDRRLARWSELLQDYDFDIAYKKGRENIPADALSRIPISGVSIASFLSAFDYSKDPFFSDIYKSLTLSSKLYPSFFIRRDLLFLKGERNRLCVPRIRHLITDVIKAYHDSRSAGHQGFERTYDLISKHLFWPNMSQDIKEYVSTCQSCQVNKASNNRKQNILKPLEIPYMKWTSISMDFLGPLPRSQGFDTILVIMDRFTKRTHLIQCKQTDGAKEIATLFIENIFRHHGLPSDIVSDRDTRFTSEFWNEVMKTLEISLSMGTAFHPQTDGQTERQNRVIEEMLRHFVNYNQDNWVELLPIVEFAINNSKSISSGYTPFELEYGVDPISQPLQQIVDSESNRITDANEFVTRIAQTLKQARDNLVTAQQRQIRAANRYRRLIQFNDGDMVLLNSEFYHRASLSGQPTQKLSQKWLGPFKIIKAWSDHEYQLELPHDMERIYPIINVENLKLFRISDESKFPNRSESIPEPVEIGGETEFEVERILDKRKFRKKIQYLVKWTGYGIQDSEWINSENLPNAQELIEEFEANSKEREGM